MNYLTQPGTIPHLAIEHLRSLPPGKKLSTAELADAIGHDKATLAACLRTPRDHGAVCSEPIPGSPAHRWWVPADQRGADKPEPTPEPIHGPASPWKAPARAPKPLPEPTPAPAPAPEIQQPQTKPGSDLRFGIFDDGSMSIEVGGMVIELGKRDTRRLARFIQRAPK